MSRVPYVAVGSGALEQVLGAVYAVVAAGLLLHIGRGVGRKRFDPFFAIFAGSALIYLELVPSLIVFTNGVQAGPNDALFQSYGLPPENPDTYLFVQTMIWILFLAPLFWAYRLPPLNIDKQTEARRKLVVSGSNYRWACWGSIAFSLIYLVVEYKHRLLFNRTSYADITQSLTGLSTANYFIVRTFQLGAFFIVGVLIVARAHAERRVEQKRLRNAAAVVSAIFLLSMVANSRVNAILFLLNGVAWLLVSSQQARARAASAAARVRRSKIVSPIGLIAVLLALFLVIEVSLNVREEKAAQHDGQAAPALTIYSPIHGDGGLFRFDGVDILARIESGVGMTGAMGRAWQAAPWMLGLRYVEPSAYKNWVAENQTNAVQYATDRWMGERLPDYYSTEATDMFANFSWWGFILDGVIFGVGYNFIRRRIYRLSTLPPAVVLGVIMLATQWLKFESESQTLLFNWLVVIPIYLGFWLFKPFRSVAVESEPAAPIQAPLQRANGRPT